MLANKFFTVISWKLANRFLSGTKEFRESTGIPAFTGVRQVPALKTHFYQQFIQFQ